jgi:acyl dehydratase
MSDRTPASGKEAPRYLEDFNIGDRIDTPDVEVTRESIRTFAELYDPQPMHMDDEAARNTVFGRLVASGWQTLGITMRLILDARFLGSTPIVAAEFSSLRFHRPVLPGAVCTTDQDGHVVVTQTWTLVVPKRPAD